MKDPTKRFTDTVDNYVKYRPGYPVALLSLLSEKCGLRKESIIADIGSGTGILTKLFLDFGNTVYGVEPNEAMRNAGEEYLKDYSQFHSVNGSAEVTTLADASVDFVTAGTAFHWFDAQKTKQEFKRILKSPGTVVLVWNVRDAEHSALVRDYENILLNYNTDYQQSNAEKFDKTLGCDFFHPYEMHEIILPYEQTFQWEGFKGRLLSSSYMLRADDPRYEEMLEKLREIFDKHQKNGMVSFLYATKLYYGQLTP